MPQRILHLLADNKYIAELSVVRPCLVLAVAFMAELADFPLMDSLVGWLFLWWAGLATGEVLSCYLCTHRALRQAFPWERKVTGKLVLVFILLVAVSLDWMFYQLGTALPPTWQKSLLPIALPVTTASLVWLNIAEGARIIVNIGQTEGRDSIPPVVRWVLTQMKRVDMERYPGSGEPHERWSDPDKLTDDQIRELLVQGGIIDAEGRLKTPPRPSRRKGAADGKN